MVLLEMIQFSCRIYSTWLVSYSKGSDYGENGAEIIQDTLHTGVLDFQENSGKFSCIMCLFWTYLEITYF